MQRKLAKVIVLTILAGSTVSIAQSIPAPTGDGPSWGWVAAFTLLVLLMTLAYVIKTYNVRIEKLEVAHADLLKRHELLKDRIADHHLDANETRTEISNAIRLAVAEHLPVALKPIQDAIAALSTQINKTRPRNQS